VAPAHEYGPGHRGIDLDLLGDSAVRAPADGIVAFAGDVAGRGILTIDHGNGLVTTLEPVDTVLVPGTQVRRGENVAMLAAGGHAASGELHFGVRLHGKYINPMLLLGGVPRAVLLPCCE
jgi:murein DD-endopeptidase MepM/ murein hydrolase activator NlpD